MQLNPQQPALNPNQFNTVNMGGGGMNNPFGGAVQNYQTQAAANPFGGPGPSLESWQRDVQELGGKTSFNIEKKTEERNNIKQFSDLFATGLEKI